MKTASITREAGLQEVINKITKRIRDSEMAQRLTEKVTRFFHTKNPADDLSPAEVSAIYRPNEYGDDFDMPGGKELDVGWSNHAEFRTDLRDIDPTKVNEAVRNFAETHPNKHQKINLINHAIGKAVVDINTTVEPERAGVVTVIASMRESLIAGRIVKALINKKAPEGMLLVQLAAMPNPDFGDDSWESQIKILPRFSPVHTMKEAVREVDKFIKENNLGGGNWTGGKVMDDSGMVVAQITYNRRVWMPGKYPQPEIKVDEFDSNRK